MERSAVLKTGEKQNLVKWNKTNRTTFKMFALKAVGPFSYHYLKTKMTVLRAGWVDGEIVLIEKSAEQYLDQFFYNKLVSELKDNFNYLINNAEYKTLEALNNELIRFRFERSSEESESPNVNDEENNGSIDRS